MPTLIPSVPSSPAPGLSPGSVDLLRGDSATVRPDPLEALQVTLEAQRAGRTDRAATLDPLPPELAFTPATILALVARRVRSLESELAGLIDAFESHTARSDELAGQLEALHQVQQQANARRGGDVRLDETIEAAGGLTVGEVLAQAGFPESELDLRDGDNLDAGTLEGMISEKNAQLKREGTGVELIMLRIQTKVTQRGEAITLGTNLISALDRADRDVIGNIG